MKPGIDYIGVNSGAFIFNSKGQVLLTRAKGGWEFPSSIVKFGEHRKDAIQRHAKKLGLDIDVKELFDVVENIEKQHWLESSFLAKCHSCKVQKEHRWTKLFDIKLEELSDKGKQNYMSYLKKNGNNAPLFIK